MATAVKIAALDATATSGGSVSVRIKGGQKLRRFIFNANNPRLVAQLAAESIRRNILPSLKAAMPRRTGALITSLEIRQNGVRIELWGIFYARYVTVNGVRIVIDVLMDLLEKHRRAIGNDVIRGLR